MFCLELQHSAPALSFPAEGDYNCVAQFFECESGLRIVPTPSSPNLQSGLQFYTVAAEEDRDHSTGLFEAKAQSATGSQEINTPEPLARCAGTGKVPTVGVEGRLTGKSAIQLDVAAPGKLAELRKYGATDPMSAVAVLADSF